MASLVDSWQITWVRVSDNMGEKLSVSAPYVGNPLLPSRLHDDDVHQQHSQYKWTQYAIRYIFEVSKSILSGKKFKQQINIECKV